jgi:dUTP pyrophosphatase
VLLVNLGDKPFAIARGERIAQLVVARVEHVELVEATTASATRRGAGGFGSTGTATRTRSRKRSVPAKRRKPNVTSS